MRIVRVLTTALVVGLVSSPLAAQATGSVKGRVLEKGTSQPIVGATVVIVVGSGRLGELTGNNGNYVIHSVPAGQVVVRAIRIGYAPDSIRVDIPSSGEVTADFSLAKVATQLEAVVTTATGDQSRKEIGNVIASVAVDSLAGRAPVTNITEVLQARTPGVQIIQGSGLTGASPSIRIRGTSSLSLSNEPLIIVDGVRVDNSAAPGAIGGSVTTTRVNRFGAFNADDIESIDIIKGPSAAALYGTAAANGVLVIKTKRGATRWNLYGEAGQVSQPATFADNYRSWGRNLVGGVAQPAPVTCRLSDQSLKRCVADSVTTFNPLMNSETTPFKTQPRYLLGAQASGGNSAFTFFLSAEHGRIGCRMRRSHA